MERMSAAEYLKSQGIERPKRNKFNAKKVKAWGIQFDSKAEMRRYGDLRALQMAGEISNLEPHPKYGLHAHGKQMGQFTADSRYHEGELIIVEDVKSEATAKLADYKQRIRLFKACYPHLTFREYMA